MTDKLKKILIGVVALAALALGGSALAGATSGGGGNNSAVQDRGETAGDHEDGADDQSDVAVTGADATRAREAAQAETGGTPGHVERDNEKGATYEVEVKKADGSQVDVRLDAQFKVIAVDQDTENGQADEQDDDHGQQGEQDDDSGSQNDGDEQGQN